jgi:hypothetical protein
MKPPRIDAVTVLAPGVLEIHWTTGETLAAHINDWIERFELLAPLQDANLFAQASRDRRPKRCRVPCPRPTSTLLHTLNYPVGHASTTRMVSMNQCLPKGQGE